MLYLIFSIIFQFSGVFLVVVVHIHSGLHYILPSASFVVVQSVSHIQLFKFAPSLVPFKV